MNYSLQNHGESPNNMVQTSSSLIWGHRRRDLRCDLVISNRMSKINNLRDVGKSKPSLHFLFQQRIMQPLHGAVWLVGWKKEELRGGERWKSLAIYLYVGRVPLGRNTNIHAHPPVITCEYPPRFGPKSHPPRSRTSIDPPRSKILASSQKKPAAEGGQRIFLKIVPLQYIKTQLFAFFSAKNKNSAAFGGRRKFF